MDCVVVLVSCWFGGIKFGIGGFVCVYGGGVVKCLQQVLCSELVECCWVCFVCVFVDYVLFKVCSLVLGVSVVVEDYGVDGVVLILELLVVCFEVFQVLLVDFS